MDKPIQIIKAITRIKEHADFFREHNANVFDGISLAEAHCIDKIGSIDCANVTKIASAMSMSKGAISKITKKLLCKQLIESYQKIENNKEIYFCLTETGKQVYGIHKECHKLAMQKKIDILSKYSDEEMVIILRFLNDLTKEYDAEIEKEN
ncbi:MAG: MarR family transcriptional regulator [Acidaminococcaceae bacterium]